MGSCFTIEPDVDFDGPGTLVVRWPGNGGPRGSGQFREKLVERECSFVYHGVWVFWANLHS